jgi:hypothetical protein
MRSGLDGKTTRTISRLPKYYNSADIFSEPQALIRVCGNSALVSHVPPLRGLALHSNTAPPLPRWATIFRPWRDWNKAPCAVSPLAGSDQIGLRCILLGRTLSRWAMVLVSRTTRG